MGCSFVQVVVSHPFLQQRKRNWPWGTLKVECSLFEGYHQAILSGLFFEWGEAIDTRLFPGWLVWNKVDGVIPWSVGRESI